MASRSGCSVRMPSLPARRSSPPAGKSSLPAGKSSLPAGKPLLPAAKSSLPAGKSSLPAAKSSLPAGKSSLPAVESSLPAVESLLPARESLLPARYSSFPADRASGMDTNPVKLRRSGGGRRPGMGDQERQMTTRAVSSRSWPSANSFAASRTLSTSTSGGSWPCSTSTRSMPSVPNRAEPFLASLMPSV